MNYEKVQQYLKSLQNAGITHSELNGYQNYINNSKLNRQRSAASQPIYSHPRHLQGYPGYPPSVCSGYTTNGRMYTLPHSYQSNFYQDFYMHDERKNHKDLGNCRHERKERKKPITDDLCYTGVDRELADSYLKSIEAKDHQQAQMK